MILQFIEELNTKTIILASSSARRHEILKNLGLKFTIVPSTFKENLKEDDFVHPRDYVTATAVAKAEEVRDRLVHVSGDSSPPDLIIGCDTCVTLDGKIYGKPTNDDHASEMLQMWSGRTQDVISGVCILHRLCPDGGAWQRVTFHETTRVTFGLLTTDAIQAYVRTHEPRGKAGAYGIQGLGGSLVESIQGDYYNVMGFPLHHFCKELVPLLQRP